MKKVAKPAGHHQTVRQLMLGTVSTLGVLAAAATTASAKTITVKQGDTVWNLANQAGVSVKAVEQANPSVTRLNNSVDLIHAGQTLNLPSREDSYYVVKRGDTLEKIANRYHVTVAQLTAWNHLNNPDLIQVGQRLLVHGGQLTAQSQSTTEPAAPVAAQQSNSTEQSSSVQQAQQPATPPASGTQQQVSQPTVDQQPVVQPDQADVNQQGQSNQQSQINAAPARGDQAGQQETAATTTAADQQAEAQQQSAATDQANVVNDDQQSQQPLATNNQQSAAESTPWIQYAVVIPQDGQDNSDVQQTNQTNSQNNEQSAQQQAPTQNNEATTQPPVNNQQSGSQNSGNADLQTGSVVSLAVKLANSNIPYVWGGNNLSGMDCSGLVDYVYAHSEGKQLPHYTVSLESCVSQKPVSQAQPGDLLFWGQHGSTYHVAIYIGNNQYVAAPQPGQNVEIETISSYFAPSFAGSVN